MARDNRNVTLFLPPPRDVPDVNLLPAQAGQTRQNQEHAPDVLAKARLMDAFTALFHKSHAVLIFILGMACASAIWLFAFKSAIPIGGDLMERGAMIGSVFGENATQNAPGDPRGVQ